MSRPRALVGQGERGLHYILLTSCSADSWPSLPGMRTGAPDGVAEGADSC